ncbi:hypothetical protein ACWGB8_11505 [Kitasatospora sp. NPDC054939]
MAGIRKSSVAVVMAALALTATACGGDKDKTEAAPTAAQTPAASPSQAGAPTSKAPADPPAKLSPAALLKLVGEKTNAAKSAKVKQEVEIGANGVLVYNGAISWEDGMLGELTVDAGDSPLGKQMSPLTGSTTLKYRYLKDAMYLKLGTRAVSEFNGRHWLRYGYDDLSKVLGAGGDSLKNQLRNADPQAGVRALIASGKVTEVGEVTVNGTRATHYSGELTADDLATATSRGLDHQQIKDIKDQFQTAGITTEHVEVWIDTETQLLVRRLEKAETANGPVKVTVDYSDYGTKVDTVEPAASDSVEITELLKQAQGGGAS